jgi:putative membrane protein
MSGGARYRSTGPAPSRPGTDDGHSVRWRWIPFGILGGFLGIVLLGWVAVLLGWTHVPGPGYPVGFWPFFPFGFFLFFVLFFFVARTIWWGGGWYRGGPGRYDVSAREILARRYARGEIGRDEYREMLRVLEEAR